ncbi:MAG TPA: phosphotransferase [Clostridia bacterium]|nr:phosphotransferase [Clostridia bacterium]
MDDSWERGIPFVELDLPQVEAIFRQWQDAVRVLSLAPIRIGCRNSNYRVDTNQGPYLLRIAPEGSNLYRNEWAVHEGVLVLELIPVLAALYVALPLANRHALIYEYIPSVSLGSLAMPGFSADIVGQVARLAAAIHGSPSVPGLAEAAYPPYETWYRLFAENPHARARLGERRIERVLKLVESKARELREIDAFQGLIHSDFRPANMLADAQGLVYVVDWEYAGKGHLLGDIGQFFRYRQCFTPEDMALFERVYNAHAPRPLPPDWRELSLLRDLVNPLQGLGGAEDRPNMHADWLRLVDEDLAALGF